MFVVELIASAAWVLVAVQSESWSPSPGPPEVTELEVKIRHRKPLELSASHVEDTSLQVYKVIELAQDPKERISELTYDPAKQKQHRKERWKGIICRYIYMYIK